MSCHRWRMSGIRCAIRKRIRRLLRYELIVDAPLVELSDTTIRDLRLNVTKSVQFCRQSIQSLQFSLGGLQGIHLLLYSKRDVLKLGLHALYAA
jgi:hypothetical protein